MTRILLAFAICAFPLAANAQGITIPNLAAASALLGPEQIPAVQGGLPVRLTPAQIQAFLEGASNIWSVPQQFNGTGLAAALTAVSVGTQNAQLWQQTGNSPNGAAALWFDVGGNLFLSNNVSGDSAYFGSLVSGNAVLFTNNISRLIVNTLGNVSINAPSSGSSLAVGALDNAAATEITDGIVVGGTEISSIGPTLEFGTFSNHALSLFTNNLVRGLITAGGNWTIDAPASGTTLDVLALPGQPALRVDGPLQLHGYTVSTLPTCNSGIAGTLAYVTDALSPTYDGPLTGAGNKIIPVFCDGASWTAH